MYNSCMYMVCFSIQVIRYNRLLNVIQSTLKDLLKALKGLVVMSQELETMFNSLYNNSVPKLWANKVMYSLCYRYTYACLYMYIMYLCLHPDTVHPYTCVNMYFFISAQVWVVDYSTHCVCVC